MDFSWITFDTLIHLSTLQMHQIGKWWIDLVKEYQQHPLLGMHVVFVWWLIIQLYRKAPWTWMHHVRKGLNPQYQMPGPKYLWLMDISVIVMLVVWWNIPIEQSPYLELLRSSATAIEGTRWLIGFVIQKPSDWEWIRAKYYEHK